MRIGFVVFTAAQLIHHHACATTTTTPDKNANATVEIVGQLLSSPQFNDFGAARDHSYQGPAADMAHDDHHHHHDHHHGHGHGGTLANQQYFE